MKINFNNFKLTLEKNLNSLSLILLHGSNQSEIKEMCDEATTLFCGPLGSEEMRVNKLHESILLKDPNRLNISIKTVSFFPGKQVVIVEGASDKITKPLSDTLKNWTTEDAITILLSNALKSTSSLRKFTELDPSSISVAVYDEQRNIEKINRVLKSTNLNINDKLVSNFLKNPKNFISMQSFILFIEKLENYKFLDQSPVTFEDIDILLTDKNNRDEFEMLILLANGDVENMMQLLRQLVTSGIKPNRIINSASRHFFLLHQLSLNRYNPDVVLSKNYPPLFGKKRDQVITQSKMWSTHIIERALEIILQLDKKMRSSPQIELTSLLERSFLRISALIKPIS